MVGGEFIRLSALIIGDFLPIEGEVIPNKKIKIRYYRPKFAGFLENCLAFLAIQKHIRVPTQTSLSFPLEFLFEYKELLGVGGGVHEVGGQIATGIVAAGGVGRPLTQG